MKTLDFINANIGERVYISNSSEYFDSEIKRIVFGQKESPVMILQGLTKGGLAYIKVNDVEYISIKPSHIRLYSELEEK